MTMMKVMILHQLKNLKLFSLQLRLNLLLKRMLLMTMMKVMGLHQLKNHKLCQLFNKSQSQKKKHSWIVKMMKTKSLDSKKLSQLRHNQLLLLSLNLKKTSLNHPKMMILNLLYQKRQ